MKIIRRLLLLHRHGIQMGKLFKRKLQNNLVVLDLFIVKPVEKVININKD